MKHYKFLLFTVLFALLQTTMTIAKEKLAVVENPLLKYVPEETIFFSGNSQLINIDNYPLSGFTQSVDIPLTQN